MLVARAAESLARRRDPISVAMGQDPVMIHPPPIIPVRRASQPSVGLVGKYHRADAVISQDSAAFTECSLHRFFEPLSVFGFSAGGLGLILDCFRDFRR